MKYFLGTEFHEYKKKPLIGKVIDTIELISIGIVNEEGREYYAICKEFDLKSAWGSFQWKTEKRDAGMTKVKVKEYWLRENVLKPLVKDICSAGISLVYNRDVFKSEITFKQFKLIINKYGKTREQIAKEVKEFIAYSEEPELHPQDFNHPNFKFSDVNFYAYYADYDWVVFCWLFGRMIDLPKGFPMYCRDLKQVADDHFKIDRDLNEYIDSCLDTDTKVTKGLLQKIFHERLDIKKAVPQTNNHNSLADAKWNKELYKFLSNL